MTAEFMRPITLTYADLGHARVAILRLGRTGGVTQDRPTLDSIGDHLHNRHKEEHYGSCTRWAHRHHRQE